MGSHGTPSLISRGWSNPPPPGFRWESETSPLIGLRKEDIDDDIANDINGAMEIIKGTVDKVVKYGRTRWQTIVQTWQEGQNGGFERYKEAQKGLNGKESMIINSLEFEVSDNMVCAKGGEKYDGGGVYKLPIYRII